jgi:hypothetical protein
MNFRLILLPCLLFSGVWLFSGCGGEELPPGVPKLYPATITVMQDGKPLADAQVICLNIDPSNGWTPGGMTDTNGVVKLRTLGRYNGAPAGTYDVSVSKIEYPDIQLPSEDSPEYKRIAKEIADNTFIVIDPKFGIGKTPHRVEISPSNLKHEVDVSPAVRIKAPTAKGG